MPPQFLHSFDPEKEEQKLAASLKNPAAKVWYEKLILGKQIRKFRKTLNLTQKEFAKKLTCHQTQIARIEAGKQNLTLDLLIRIAHALGRKIYIKLL